MGTPASIPQSAEGLEGMDREGIYHGLDGVLRWVLISSPWLAWGHLSWPELEPQ